MTKKSNATKQIIKALSVSLSVAMMMQPVTAMADEVNPENSVEPEKQEAESNETVVSEVDKAQDAEVVADKAIETADAAIDEAKIAYDALLALETEASDKELKEVNDVNVVLDSMDISVATAATSESLVVVEVAMAEDALIRETADVSVAEKAVSDATQIAENAKEDIEAAEKALADKQETFAAALDDLLEAKKAYTEALTNAESDADAAYSKLQEAQAEAAKLEKELKTVQNMFYGDKAYSILFREDEREAEAKDNWTKFNEIFYDILQYYYIPTVENGTNVKVNTFTKFQDDDSKNYCEVTYTDASGQTVSKYFNYKLNSTKTGMEMFEKEMVYVDSNGSVVSTYSEGDEVEVKPWSNANYLNNTGVISELTDESFRSWLADAQTKKDAYETLKSKANAAKEKVDTAAANVATLKQEIEILKNSDNFDEKIESLKQELENASAILEQAKVELAQAKEAANEAKESYDEAVENLALTEETAIVTPVVAEATKATVKSTTAVAAVEETKEAEVEASVEVTTVKEAVAPVVEEVAPIEESAETIVEAEEAAVPLASLREEVKEHMSLCWTILALIFGASEVEKFRRNHSKKRYTKFGIIDKDAE